MREGKRHQIQACPPLQSDLGPPPVSSISTPYLHQPVHISASAMMSPLLFMAMGFQHGICPSLTSTTYSTVTNTSGAAFSDACARHRVFPCPADTIRASLSQSTSRYRPLGPFLACRMVRLPPLDPSITDVPKPTLSQVPQLVKVSQPRYPVIAAPLVAPPLPSWVTPYRASKSR